GFRRVAMSKPHFNARDLLGKKPEKPYPDYPLFPHSNGCWAKKIRGKLHYFGPWRDPEGALENYNREKDDLHAGRKPRGADEAESLTVYSLCAKFLTAKMEQRDNGELSRRTYLDYGDLCKRLIKAFGKNRLVSDLRPDDFARLRATMAATWGPVRLGAEIVRTRVPFNWAYRSGLLDRPMLFGEGFRRPSRKVLRQAKAAK